MTGLVLRPWLRVLIALLGSMLILALSGCGLTGDRHAAPDGVHARPQTLLDIPYATQSPAQKLDLLLPERTGKAIPLVIAIHGGGWQLGDKRDVEFLAAPVLKQGYALASINYRLSGEATFPAAILDAKAAVRWLRAHAGEYGLDPGRFAAWGLSAGGNLAALLGVTGNSTFNDKALGNSGVPGTVAAVVDFYGVSDLLNIDRQFAESTHCKGVPLHQDQLDSSESLYLGGKLSTVPGRAQDASPMHYLAAAQDVPPFYLAHGLDDCVVPDRQSAELAQGLRAKGIRADLTVVPGFGHADPVFDRDQTPPAIRFLRSVFS